MAYDVNAYDSRQHTGMKASVSDVPQSAPTLSEIHEKLRRLHDYADSIMGKISNIRTELHGPFPESGNALLKEVQSGLLPAAHSSIDILADKLAHIEDDLTSLRVGLI